MPAHVKGAEPIPGYRLVERLGRGAFGDVWKVEAPGGIPKAIKFVAGARDDGSTAQEMLALERVKAIRHPFLLSLERVDLVDGELVIVMELADRDLHHRYRECQALRLPGIPRDELLRYLEEAGEALDLMNQQHRLQHLDIKPQNLFLVHNHVKVADFGLCRDMSVTQASVKDGITPQYAAPERAKDTFSAASDQYSLAVVYQELLTGRLPFSAATGREILRQHRDQPPDLAPLPSGDREAIGRALAKNPAERFASCLDLVRALRGQPLVGPARIAPPPVPDTVAIECPHCGRRGQVAGVYQGRSVKCPSCRQAFSVPFAAAQAAAETIVATTLTPQEIGLPEDIGLAPLGGSEEPEAISPADTVIETKCSKCGHRGPVPEKFLGKKLRCRKCSRVFTVTDASAQPAPKTAPTPLPAPPQPAAEEENPFANLLDNPPRRRRR